MGLLHPAGGQAESDLMVADLDYQRAVTLSRFIWWDREVERLRRERPAPGSPNHQYWAAHLCAAQDAREAMLQQLAAIPQTEDALEFRAELRASVVRSRLH